MGFKTWWLGCGDKEGNSPLPDQMKVGEGQFFWAATGEELQSPSALFRPEQRNYMEVTQKKLGTT